MSESLNWRKANRSMNHGACVEVGAEAGKVVVRDTMDPEGPHIPYTRVAWREFLGRVAANGVITQPLPGVDSYDMHMQAPALAA